MMKTLWFILLFTLNFVAYGAPSYTFSIENPMIIETSASRGDINLGNFNSFNPNETCSTLYVAPNTCIVQNRNTVRIGLFFNYEVLISELSSIDITFDFEEPDIGELVQNIQLPSPLSEQTNNSSGVINLEFDITLFGNNAHKEQGLSLTIEVTPNN